MEREVPVADLYETVTGAPPTAPWSLEDVQDFVDINTAKFDRSEFLGTSTAHDGGTILAVAAHFDAPLFIVKSGIFDEASLIETFKLDGLALDIRAFVKRIEVGVIGLGPPLTVQMRNEGSGPFRTASDRVRELINRRKAARAPRFGQQAAVDEPDESADEPVVFASLNMFTSTTAWDSLQTVRTFMKDLSTVRTITDDKFGQLISAEFGRFAQLALDDRAAAPPAPPPAPPRE